MFSNSLGVHLQRWRIGSNLAVASYTLYSVHAGDLLLIGLIPKYRTEASVSEIFSIYSFSKILLVGMLRGLALALLERIV